MADKELQIVEGSQLTQDELVITQGRYIIGYRERQQGTESIKMPASSLVINKDYINDKKDVAKALNENREGIKKIESKLKALETKNKGYYPTIASLKTKCPNPNKGDFAYVGETWSIWSEQGGEWKDSGKPIPNNPELINALRNLLYDVNGSIPVLDRKEKVLDSTKVDKKSLPNTEKLITRYYGYDRNIELFDKITVAPEYIYSSTNMVLPIAGVLSKVYIPIYWTVSVKIDAFILEAGFLKSLHHYGSFTLYENDEQPILEIDINDEFELPAGAFITVNFDYDYEEHFVQSVTGDSGFGIEIESGEVEIINTVLCFGCDIIHKELEVDLSLATEKKNGLMSAEQVKQLNEIIENMKPIEEKYDTFFHVKLKNEEPKTIYSAFLFASKGKNAELEVDGVRALIDTSEWGNSLSATVGINGDLKLWYTGGMLMKLFYLINDADTIRCVSRSPYLIEIDIDHVKARFADFSGVRYLTTLKASDTNINTLDLGNNSTIKNVFTFNNPSLTTLIVGGSVVNNIDVSYCAQLTGISFNVDSLAALAALNINNTAITSKSLMKIENVWGSRVGLTTGVLTLNEALFNELSTAEKSLFINKNITFNIA